MVGRGRDYTDVTPLKGLFSGGGSHSLGVMVEVTRLAQGVRHPLGGLQPRPGEGRALRRAGPRPRGAKAGLPRRLVQLFLGLVLYGVHRLAGQRSSTAG